MPVTKSFRDTVQARARSDIKFRQALLAEAMQALLDGDLEECRACHARLSVQALTTPEYWVARSSRAMTAE